jgi:voltage-gated potassium channel
MGQPPMHIDLKIDEKLRQRLNAWDWLVLVVALGSLALVIAETFMTVTDATAQIFIRMDRIVCAIFFADVIIRWRREKWALGFWRWGWIDLLAAMPLEPAFRAFQVVRIYRIFRVIRVLYKFQELTSGTSLNEKLLALPGVAAVMMLFSTNLILEFERNAPGATITTPGKAIWWAITTVTTVGYGDTFPVTTEGRFVAALLMLVGIALFGSMSALVTSKLILPKETKDHEEMRREMRLLHAEIKELRDELKKGQRKD